MPGTIGIVNQVLNRLKRLAATALPGNVDDEVADDSVLGHVMASSDVSNFDRSKHSLEAIMTLIDKIPASDGTDSWNAVALTAIQTRAAAAITAASLATAAELAKVPKSDGSISWNATALAAIQNACEAAFASIGGIRGEYEEYDDSTSSSTYVTAVSVTGSGRLYAIRASSAGDDTTVRITIDGVVKESPVASAIVSTLSSGIFEFSTSTGAQPLGGFGIEFKQSLLIEYKSTGTSTLKAAYGHDV